jgi:choline dehydrogenase
VNVLLLEAGDSDDIPEVMMANSWPTNIGSDRHWNFSAQPTKYVNGRALPLAMGRVLGPGIELRTDFEDLSPDRSD